MINETEWKRRNRYCEEPKQLPEPCIFCPVENICGGDPGEDYEIDIEGLETIPKKHLTIQAGHRYGFRSPVGYYQCVFLNRWLLGLEPFEVRP